MGQLNSMRHYQEPINYVMQCVRLNDLNKGLRQREDLFGIFFTSTTKETRCSVFFSPLKKRKLIYMTHSQRELGTPVVIRAHFTVYSVVMRGKFDLVQSESQVYVIRPEEELVIDSFRPDPNSSGLQLFSAHFGSSTFLNNIHLADFLKTNLTNFAAI